MNPNPLLDPVLHVTVRARVEELVDSAASPWSPAPTRAAGAWRFLLTLGRRLTLRKVPAGRRHQARACLCSR